MSKKQETILAVVLAVGLVSHFFLGYFYWDKLGSERIYSLTAYFCMDLWGFVVYLLANGRILKGMGALGMVCGAFFFYMEFNDPNLWIQRDYLTLALVLGNSFFIWVFTDKVKNKNKKL